MCKEKSVLIKINNFETLKKFAHIVCSFESEVMIYKDIESKPYNAKSILGVIALDISKSKYVEIKSKNEEEVEKFIEVMKEFE